MMSNNVFPMACPPIHVKPLNKKPFTVDYRELRWWFAIPEVGQQSQWAQYDAEKGGLMTVFHLNAVRMASIHGVRGVEIEVTERQKEKNWQEKSMQMYARLTEHTIQWLAISNTKDNVRFLTTFLDEHFEEDWGAEELRLISADSQYGPPVMSVEIGEEQYECIRVVELYAPTDKPSESGILTETFISKQGRAVLSRRYNGRQWALNQREMYEGGRPWDEKYPNNSQRVIDGQTYVHWYNSIPELAVNPSS